MSVQKTQLFSAYRKLALGLLITAIAGWSGSLHADSAADLAAIFSVNVPLNHTGAGSFSVTATVGGVETEFLLDTGASMVTVSSSVFNSIREQSTVTKVRRVGARMASGKVQMMDVYLVDHFSLGNGCDLGPVEMAVLKKGGRNLLGMNVLQQASPFAISMTPPALSLSQCGLSTPQISKR